MAGRQGRRMWRAIALFAIDGPMFRLIQTTCALRVSAALRHLLRTLRLTPFAAD
jgi:hypothetical protein